MKRLLYALSFCAVSLLAINNADAQANTSLSNLVAPIAVNKDFTPATTNAYTLGLGDRNWKNIYIASGYYLKNYRVMHSTGINNFFLGPNAGSSLVTGSFNIAVGHNSLGALATGNYNTGIGYYALTANKDGVGNTASGFEALAVNTSGIYNTANGYSALFTNSTGSYNTAGGYLSLYSNTTDFNTAYGAFSLNRNTTGQANTGIGFDALNYNTTGYNNTALGNQALQINSTGNNNTAAGYYALEGNTTGFYNSAFGTRALIANTSGLLNSATGSDALLKNVGGSGNTANGAGALAGNTNGYFNTGIGDNSLTSVTTGSYNTAIGAFSNVTFTTITNSAAIGYGATATASNQVRIGNSSVTSIGGYVNWSNISDGRFKKNIKENVAGLEFINKLKPITYNLDITGINNRVSARKADNPETEAIERAAIAEKEKVIYSGFVAQDVEKAAKSLGYDFSGVVAAQNEQDLYGLRYSEFVVPLVKAVQQLSGKNDSLQQQIATLQQDLAQIQSVLKMKPSSGVTLSGASIAQNSPNPFSANTVISYDIPQGGNTVAKIVIYDAAGKTIKQYDVPALGRGTLNLNVSNLSAGTYSYSLFVNGNIVDTKKMILMK
ncbi:MAG: tail fiber domain-containing protein [Agriterribacter sp.]